MELYGPLEIQDHRRSTWTTLTITSMQLTSHPRKVSFTLLTSQAAHEPKNSVLKHSVTLHDNQELCAEWKTWTDDTVKT